MPRKKNRLTDHDRSTALYVAQIEACYDCDLEVHLEAGGRGQEERLLNCSIWATWPEDSGDTEPLLLARGPVQTASNALYNQNVRYLLTVSMLRLMEVRLARE